MLNRRYGITGHRVVFRLESASRAGERILYFVKHVVRWGLKGEIPLSDIVEGGAVREEED